MLFRFWEPSPSITLTPLMLFPTLSTRLADLRRWLVKTSILTSKAYSMMLVLLTTVCSLAKLATGLVLATPQTSPTLAVCLTLPTTKSHLDLTLRPWLPFRLLPTSLLWTAHLYLTLEHLC